MRLNILTLVLLVCFGKFFAQETIPPSQITISGSGSHITESNFKVSKLNVVFHSKNTSTASVEVTLPTGIQAVLGSVKLETGSAGTMSNIQITDAKVTFDITGLAIGQEVKFSLEKLTTPQGHSAYRSATSSGGGGAGGVSETFTDQIKITQGSVVLQGTSPGYGYLYPIVSIGQPAKKADALKGDNTGTFQILNGGLGKVKTIYFTVEYPADGSIVYKSITLQNPALGTLTQLPSSTTNKKVFKLELTTALNNGNSVTLNEVYTLTTSCLVGTKQIKYTANWGSGDNENQWFEPFREQVRDVETLTPTPIMDLTRENPIKPTKDSPTGNTNFRKTYFTPVGGIGVAVGGVMGTMRISYSNYGVGNTSGLYDIVVRLLEEGNASLAAYYKPQNFRIVNTQTNVITPVNIVKKTSTQLNVTGEWKLADADLSTLTTDPDGTGGLSDLDGDGKFDDLPAGGSFTIEYDLIKNRQINCISNPAHLYTGMFATYLYYSDYCGVRYGDTDTKAKQDVTNLRLVRAYQRYINASDATIIPQKLQQGEDYKKAYFLYARTAASYLQYEKDWKKGLNYRFKYRVKVPSNIEVGTTIKWYEATSYPSTKPSQTPENISRTTDGSGNTIIEAISPKNNTEGYLELDLKANCGTSSTPTIQYDIYLVDDYGKSYQGELHMLCGNKSIEVICAGACSKIGPVLNSVSAIRAENSLGWTDASMQTRHTYATMTSDVQKTMLKRALYLDDIVLTAEGQQKNGHANNLYYKILLNQGVSVALKSVKITFTNGVRLNQTVSLPANVATMTHAPIPISETPPQREILINLTSALGGIPLSADDKFKIEAILNVDANYTEKVSDGIKNKFAKDLLMADKTYFFMYDTSNNESYCGTTPSPDFYVGNTYPFDGTNRHQLSGCENINIGNYMQHWSRRFNASGINFLGEFRPGRMIKTTSFTLPKTYKVTKVLYHRTHTTAKDITTHFVKTSQGDNFVYTLTNTLGADGKYILLPGNITITNAYGELLQVFVQATCKTEEGKVTDKGVVNATFYDFYYHYGTASLAGAAPEGKQAIWGNYNVEEEKRQMEYSNKPKTELKSGIATTFEVTEKEQSLDLELKNISAVKAPYTWISIPDVSGVEVIGLYDGATALNHVTSVTGQKMYHLSIDGLAAATSKNYKLKVRLIDCTNATLKVYSGWNCGEFSKGYEEANTCSDDPNTQVTFQLKYVGSEVQLKRLATPNATTEAPLVGQLKMCQDNWYEYEINSGGKGDVVAPQLSLTKQGGLEIVAVEAYYPFNSTTGISLTGVDKVVRGENAKVYDLLSTDKVLYGTGSRTDENDRKIRVRINVKPDCNFTVGSSFAVYVLGKNPCGGELQGTRDGAILSSIDGIPALAYSVINNLTYVSGNANFCAGTNGAIYKGRHEIDATLSTTETGEKGFIVIKVPAGFELKNYNQINQSNPAFVASLVSTTPTTSLSGVDEYRIKIPKQMRDNDFFEYQIEIQQKANTPAPDCEAIREIEYYTIDEVTGVTCGTTACPAMSYTTGSPKRTNVVSNKAQLLIKNVRAVSTAQNNKENITFTFDIENTSAISYLGDLEISLYNDTAFDLKVGAGDQKVGSIRLTGVNIGGSSTSTNLTSTIELAQEYLCRLRAIIEGASNHCLCNMSDIQLAVPNPISGLMDNVTVCETDELILPYKTTAPTYVGYAWTSTDLTAMNYLSAHNVRNPKFKYIGAPLTTDTTFTYTLTITRANGCTASQEVKVTVSKAPSVTTTSPQTFCTSATALDLQKVVNPTHPSLVRIYQGTILLSESTPLVDGVTYDVTQLQGTCESRKKSLLVNLNILTSPTFIDNASCTSITVAELKGRINNAPLGSIPKVYMSGGTSELSDNTIINIGGVYDVEYVSGGCTSPKSQFTLLQRTLTAIGNLTSVQLCDSSLATLTDLRAKIAQQEPTRTSAILRIYDGNGLELTVGSTPIIVGNYQYTYTEVGKCESVQKQVNVQIGIQVPTVVNPNILFCKTIVSDVYSFATGVTALANHTLKWYVDNNITTVGSTTVPTIDKSAVGTTSYWVSQVNNITTCESGRVEVKVNVIPSPTSPAITSPTSVCFGKSSSFEITAGASEKVTYKLNGGSETLIQLDSTGKARISVSNVTTAQTLELVKIEGTNGCELPLTETKTISVTAKPSAPNVTSNTTLCPTITAASVSFTSYATATAGHTLKWYDDASTTTFTTTAPSVNTNVTTKTEVTKYVSQADASGCESDRVAVKITIDDTAAPVITAPSDLVIACNDPAFATKVTTWLGTATANDACVGVTTVTNNYTAPTDPCSQGEITITFTSVDSFGNNSTSTSKIKFISAQDDDYRGSVIRSSPTATTTVKVGGADANILSNDKIYGNTATTGNVTISQVSSTHTGVSIDTTTGKVNVGAGTPSGEYTITYKICDKNNATVCSEAKVFVKVVSSIEANNDNPPSVNGKNGGSGGNVFPNDKINGNPPTPSTVVITGFIPATPIVTGNPNVPVLDPSTGNVTVPPNTPSGTYTITYKICEKDGSGNATTNCSNNATVTIVVTSPTIDAVDNTYNISNGVIGGNTESVLGNDSYNGTGNPNPTTEITLIGGSPTYNGGTPTTNLVLNPDGTITVKPNTPSGTYEYPYTICDRLNPSVCDTAKATIVVGVPIIDAQDDDFSNTPVEGRAGKTNVGNVLSNNGLGNDTYGGNPATTTEVVISVVTGATPKVTGAKVPELNTTTGIVTVPTGTPEGVYEITYKICDRINTTNCDTAKITVKVVRTPIEAINDNLGNISGILGGTTATVLTNDTLGGSPVDKDDITITPDTSKTIPTGFTINGEGKITVPAGTPSGTYVYPYTICEKLNPTNCDSAEATITVTAGTINAVDDDMGVIVSKIGGSTTTSVLNGDTLNGGAATTGNVTIGSDPSETNPSGFTLNADGTITVAPNTPRGIYTYYYQICEKLNPTNCSQAKATIRVVDIEANDDTPSINGKTGGEFNVVTDNDKLNGTSITDSSKVTITPPTSLPPGVTFDPSTGKVTVTPNTPSGTHTFTYKICEVAHPTNCDDATVTLTISQATIIANPDELITPPVISKLGGSITDVLVNDRLNGAPAPLTDVHLRWNVSKIPSGFTVTDGNGSVVVAPGTAAGDYELEYTICDKVNPTNCSTTSVKVKVVSIEAHANTYNVSQRGGTTANPILGDDKLNGSAITDVSKVTFSWGTRPSDLPSGVVLNTDGTITVPAGTAANTYQIPYTICEVANPTNCDETTITLVITNASNTTIANDDSVSTTKDTPITIAVKQNDSDPEGDTQGNPTIQTPPTNGTVVVNSDGTITYTPNTGYAGTDKFIYQICDNGTPVACDTAEVEVKVTSLGINAEDDDYRSRVINGKIGEANVGDVLLNDRVGSYQATLSNVTITVERPATPFVAGTNVPVLNPSTGKVSVPANTPSGEYVIEYKITDGTGTSDTAKVYVLVRIPSTESELDLVKEAVAVIENPYEGQEVTYKFSVTYRGTESLTNVKITDPRIGVTITVPDLSPTRNGFTTAVAYKLTRADIEAHKIENSAIVSGTKPDGNITTDRSDNNTPSTDEDKDGDTGNDPTVTIFRTIKANPDYGTVALDSSFGGVVPNLNIFENDKLNGLPVDKDQVVLTPGSSSILTINPDGSVSIDPETPKGTYKITYTICDKVLTNLCSTTDVTVEVDNHCVLEFYNGLSVNGDGLNDQLQIKNIECYPENTLRIFNRWGVEVYNTEGYNNVSKVFDGISTGRVTINKQAKLPQGTYYLILDYKLRNGNVKRKGTWIYIAPEVR